MGYKKNNKKKQQKMCFSFFGAVQICFFYTRVYHALPGKSPVCVI